MLKMLCGRSNHQDSNLADGAALYRCDSVGHRLRNTKLRHTWTLHLAGEQSETKVELLHSRISGKKQIRFNGEVVHFTKERTLQWSRRHHPSQILISLWSENGSHQLSCCEPDQSPAVILASNVDENTAEPRTSPDSNATVGQAPAPGFDESSARSPSQEIFGLKPGAPEVSASQGQQDRTLPVSAVDACACEPSSPTDVGLVHTADAESCTTLASLPTVAPQTCLEIARASQIDDETLLTVSRGSATSIENARLRALLEEKEAEIAALQENAVLRSLVEDRDNEIASLQARISTHSGASDKPPIALEAKLPVNLPLHERDAAAAQKMPEPCTSLDEEDLDVTRRRGIEGLGFEVPVQQLQPVQLQHQAPLAPQQLQQHIRQQHASTGSLPAAVAACAAVPHHHPVHAGREIPVDCVAVAPPVPCGLAVRDPSSNFRAQAPRMQSVERGAPMMPIIPQQVVNLPAHRPVTPQRPRVVMQSSPPPHGVAAMVRPAQMPCAQAPPLPSLQPFPCGAHAVYGPAAAVPPQGPPVASQWLQVDTRANPQFLQRVTR